MAAREELQVARDELDRQGGERAAARRELAEAQQALRHHADRTRALRDILHALLLNEPGPEAVQAVLSRLRPLLPFVRASVATFDLQAGTAALYATLAQDDTPYAEGWQGPLEWVWFRQDLHPGQIHRIDDLDSIESSSPLAKALQVEGISACLNVPLVAHGQTIGVLSLGLALPTPGSQEQADFLCEVADVLALAIVQARLNERAERNAARLERRVIQRTAALRASQDRLRTVLESAPIGITVLDREGRLIRSNSMLHEILDYTREELHGTELAALTHPNDAPAERARFKELGTAERHRYLAELRLIRKDKRVIWATVNVSLMQADKGQHGFAVATVRDITRQKEAQEALVQAEKLSITGRLAASLAHEINNPLQAVIGCLGLAETKLKRGEDVTRFLEVAHTEMRRAARIVARLRDLNRRSRPEERRPADVNELLERAFTVSAKQCQDRHVQVDWERIENLPRVWLVPDQIEQVFLNLILNAIEAMPGGGWLRASTTRTTQPDGVRICFSDTGVGIPQDVLPILFEPFYTTRPEGVGLGLYVTQNIVQEHGGQIGVESRVGEGTTFSVWLPA